MKDQKANKGEGKGALIIVGRRDQDKFFSNGMSWSIPYLRMLLLTSYPIAGLDFANSQKDPNFFQRQSYVYVWY